MANRPSGFQGLELEFDGFQGLELKFDSECSTLLSLVTVENKCLPRKNVVTCAKSNSKATFSIHFVLNTV